jgi:hypothetical protein
MRIPPEVEVKASLPTNSGRASLLGPGRVERVDLNPYRRGRRAQALAFGMARDLTRTYVNGGSSEAPAHVLFPQILRIVQRYIAEKVTPVQPAERLDLFLSPYYGWAIERLSSAIRPDVTSGEAPEVPRVEQNREPGSTKDVDYATRRTCAKCCDRTSTTSLPIPRNGNSRPRTSSIPTRPFRHSSRTPGWDSAFRICTTGKTTSTSPTSSSA